jgi:hypothetical protein
MFRKKFVVSLILITLIFLSLLLLSCAPRTETIEVAVTRVVAEMEYSTNEEAGFSTSSSPSLSRISLLDSDGELGAIESVAPSAPADAVEDISSGAAPAEQQPAPQERLIIRNGELSLVVTDTEEAIFKITEMVEANGGWVVNSNLYQYNETTKTGSIRVRVPSSGFSSALEAMKGLAVEVRNESTSGLDVTDEYVDLSLRLENLEATADRVRSFLDEARNVEDALAVNIELSRLEGEIELIKGRIQYLSQSASYSTITVQLTPDILSTPIEVGGWQPKGIARDAIEALVNGLQEAANFLIWFGIYILPLGLLYGVPLFFVVRFVRRRIRQRRAQPTSEA